ncbi:MAG: hypothetical protein JJE22_14970 [Bacteroidia bacterium]|nr:hypothetical protein [Bacteroidia bacterium]
MDRTMIVLLTLIISLQSKSINQIENFYSQKIITPTINPKGRVLIGRDTLAIDQLADEFQTLHGKVFRYWKNV